MEGMKRVCLLTGASGTFGRAFIERFADRYHIAAVHHEQPIDFATQDQIFVDPLSPGDDVPTNDDAVYAIRADLSSAKEVARVAEESLAAFGHIDLLINAAARREWSSLLDAPALVSANEVLSINVLVPLRLAVEVAQRFWSVDPAENAAQNRSIVNISSTAGLFVYPDCGQGLYATSKAALDHLTYHMACEFWDLGVRVNAIAPDTFPGRVSVEDVVAAAVELDTCDTTGDIGRLVGPTP
jgi:NAD(P)-dependent dehydrogenase (short-subunit alcohol dehydrogenase family)